MHSVEHSVTFSVHVKSKLFQNIKIVGSSAGLGNWSPDSGMLLQTSDITYPYWHSSTSLRVPTNYQLQFKIIGTTEDHIIQWELGENRRLKITNDVLLQCSWGQPLLKIQPKKKCEHERKKSERLLQVDYADDFIQLSLKSDEGFTKTNSLLFLKSQSDEAPSLQVHYLHGCGKGLKQSTLKKDELQRSLFAGEETFIFTKELSQLQRLKEEGARNICLFSQQLVNVDTIKLLLQCQSIIFNSFQALEAYLSVLKQRKTCFITHLNARIVINTNHLQILQVCAKPTPNTFNDIFVHLLAYWTRTIFLCRRFVNERLMFNQRLAQMTDPSSLLLLVNAKYLTESTALNKLLKKFPHICILFEQEAEISWISPEISEIVSLIHQDRAYFKPAKRYSKLEWQQPEVRNSLDLIQNTIKKLGFGNLLTLKHITKQCLEISSNSMRMSQMMLEFIAKEINQHPDYRSLQVISKPNKLYVHRLSLVYWINQLTRYLNSGGLIVVGEPLYLGILDAHHCAPFVSSVQILLRYMDNTRS